jgi:outer membrane scaffolding protein for murein synthesis (MipA/OmpV family)
LNHSAFLPLLAALIGFSYPHASQAAATPGDEAETTLSLGVERSNRSMFGDVSDKPRWWPTFEANYKKGRFFAGTQSGIGYNLVQESGFHAFVAAGADPGRKDGDRKHSPRLVGMGKIDGTALAIAGGGYQAFDGLIKLDAAHMISAKRSYGSQTVMSAALAYPIWGDKLSGSLSLTATHADHKYAQTYYGVTTAQAARSGNRVYTARADWITCDASLGLNYQVDKHWSASASIGRHELREAAALSPLFATKKSTVGAASVSYRF